MQIRIDDEVYERLKAAADKDGRTVGAEIDYLLSNRVELADIKSHLESTPAPKIALATPKEEGMKKIKVRTPAVIQADIDKLKADEAEELEYCQDAEVGAEIHQRYADAITRLENELSEYWRSKNAE